MEKRLVWTPEEIRKMSLAEYALHREAILEAVAIKKRWRVQAFLTAEHTGDVEFAYQPKYFHTRFYTSTS